MDEVKVQAAQERLARAKARVHEVVSQRKHDLDLWRLADDELLEAERELAAVTGQEYARTLPLDVAWDIGAPMPFLISNGSTAAVVFHLRTHDPDWDGTYVSVADSASPVDEPVGVIEFIDLREVSFGGLNDEAIEGHPLWGKGLDAYGAHEVVNSAWITESERRNSVHPFHRGGWHQTMRHYILCFHDETLECLASDLRTSRVVSSYSDAVRSVTARLLART